jgi:cytochrome c oxidase subunit 2
MAAKADDPSKVWTVDELKQRGEKVYAANCVACHQANGKGGRGLQGAGRQRVVNGPAADPVLLNGERHAGLEALNDTESPP